MKVWGREGNAARFPHCFGLLLIMSRLMSLCRLCRLLNIMQEKAQQGRANGMLKALAIAQHQALQYSRTSLLLGLRHIEAWSNLSEFAALYCIVRPAVPIIGIMGPPFPTPKKECYTVLILQIFGKRVSQAAVSGAGPAILVLRIKGGKGAWNGRLEGARRHAFNRCEARVETGWRL